LLTKYIFTPNPNENDIDTTLKEITEHGDSLFPIAVHFTSHQSGQKNMIHKHWHRELEILYICRGNMIVNVEEESFLVEAGDIVFVPSNLLHEAIHYQNNECAFFAVVFDKSFIESRLNDHIQQSCIDPIIHDLDQHALHISKNDTHYSEARDSIIKIIDLFALKEPFYELTLKAYLFLFLKGVLLNTSKIRIQLVKPDSKSYLNSYKCKKTLLYIEENYKRPISLTEISNHIGYSKEHFCRFFKKNFRVPFFTYLNQMRIKKAEYLLLNTKLKIIDVALETGFEDPNYFTTVFKKETNCTPSHYRTKPNNVTKL
jgi:AraC-like DNA-binding protein/mannose-6-phosphate isomerase-like protein (cupin superfamily)